MHGTPRFVLGVYDSGGGYSPNPAHWEQQIFSPAGSRGLQGFPLNVYLNYWLGAMPFDSTEALLDVLHNHGMMYLQTGNCFADGSWTRYGPGSFSIMSQTYVQQYAQHPAALGYYIMDECEDSLIPETEAHDAELHVWDPQGITFAANLAAGYRNPALWIDAADIMGTDPYPLYGPEPAAGYTHFIVADFVSKLRAVAYPDRPVWAVLQFFKFTTDSRMPTPDEMRAHAVMSIVEGAQGIFWWDIGVNGLRKLDAATVSTYMNHLRTLTTELAGLEPALLAPAAPTALIGNSTRFADPIQGRISQLDHNIAVEWLFSRKQWYLEEKAALQAGDTSKSGGMLNDAATVRTLAKVVGDVGYVFAYNYKNSSTPVTFTWHTAPTGVRESQTGQTFPLNGAQWSDNLGPYQARIYVIDHAGNAPFSDVPAGHAFRPWIDALVQAGITGGCATNPARYCPDSPVTRAQMAVFLLRSIAYPDTVSPPESPTVFVDVPTDHPFARWINALFDAGITAGCASSPARYCPESAVTRAQMAVLLLRAKYGPGYQPPTPTTQRFTDVGLADPFAPWIDRLAEEGITGGCSTNPAQFCPGQIVTRAQMAVFLVRTFGLPLL